MLKDVRMTLPPLSFSGRNFFMQSSFSQAKLSLALASALCLAAVPMLLSGCNRASAGTTIPTASPQAVDSARQQLDLVPPPSKSRYMAIHSLADWENPYLTVQQNMATLHLTQADANPSQFGAGGMLRPVAARRQDLTVRVSDLPAALDALPESSWPYGRVVASRRRTTRPSRPVPRSAATSKPPSRPSATWASSSTNGPKPASADFRSRCLRRCLYLPLPDFRCHPERVFRARRTPIPLAPTQLPTPFSHKTPAHGS